VSAKDGSYLGTCVCTSIAYPYTSPYTIAMNEDMTINGDRNKKPELIL